MVLRQHTPSGGTQDRKPQPLLRNLLLFPPPTPVAWVVALASSPAAPPRIPAGRGSMGGTLPLSIGLPLPSPLSTVAWIETPASSPVASPQVQAYGGVGWAVNAVAPSIRYRGEGLGAPRLGGNLHYPSETLDDHPTDRHLSRQGRFSGCWTVCSDNKLTDVAETYDTLSRVTRTSSLL